MSPAKSTFSVAVASMFFEKASLKFRSQSESFVYKVRTVQDTVADTTLVGTAMQQDSICRVHKM